MQSVVIIPGRAPHWVDDHARHLGQRLTETSRHYAAAAYARGVYDSLPVGSPVRWEVDPQQPPCPDCDDNVLGGTLAKGEEFPTGHASAPAHPGCRCLVLAADS